MFEEANALLARGGRWAPRWGWHDDHVATEGTPFYLPAVQQVRAEFAALIRNVPTGRGAACLQLGLGECDASHHLLRLFFRRVVTIDLRRTLIDDGAEDGLDTRGAMARALARRHAPFDLLFIDADHTYDGVRADHERYEPLVRVGGVVAFHDALPRDRYPDLEVYRYVEELGLCPFGAEVGIAWYDKT